MASHFDRMLSPVTERTRRHRLRKKIRVALAVAERLRALPDVAAVAQALALLRSADLDELKEQLDAMAGLETVPVDGNSAGVVHLEFTDDGLSVQCGARTWSSSSSNLDDVTCRRCLRGRR